MCGPPVWRFNDLEIGESAMLKGLMKKIFGSHHERALKELWLQTDEINAAYEQLDSLSDDEIKAKTEEFRGRLQDGETLQDIMFEAFGVVKQACKRNVGQRWMAADMPFEWVEVPYDVQLIGGLVLHSGRIAEMATGEGKTLVAVLPLYLNGLEGRGCHLATFNDMLARRDSEWTGRILQWLGLTVGCIQQSQEPAMRRRMYASDVTYGQSSEFGFDYLRDNMAGGSDQLVQGARSLISEEIAQEVLADLKDIEGARVVTNAFRTLMMEVPVGAVGGILEKYGARFSVAELRVDWRGEKADVALPELPSRAPEVKERFSEDFIPEGMAHLRIMFLKRDHHYIIVDEVDSLLIDEARTPLIISGQVDRSTQRYDKMNPLVQKLVSGQTRFVADLLDQANALLKTGDEEDRYKAGIKLLQAKKAMPKNKRFMKMFADSDINRLITKCENDFIVDQKSKMGQKSMSFVEEELYFSIDEKGHSVDLSEMGRLEVSPDNPDRFLLADLVDEYAQIEGDEEMTPEEREAAKEKLRVENEVKSEELHNISQLLRAYTLFEKEVAYIVKENKIVIVDEFTGRPQPGRRYSDGLHQAIEAKEGVKIEKESQTLATITIQNYCRMYDKLAGMTGTAETEAAEFGHTYKTDVVVIPTNRPIVRDDMNDCIYRTKREKYAALVQEVARLREQGLPVLIGTVSVEVSELLSRMLKRAGISHSVLNAKHLQKEAEIVRDAGLAGAVTIATNMAGRGTDIKLGPGVLEPTDKIKVDPDQMRGLQIIGTERHEARRIDRQLRGRAGRQGDPGTSKFFLSLEDDLMRLFGSERISGIMSKLGLEDGEDIQHSFVTKAITRAQKKIEGINFEQRKRTLDYDNVMNKQRESLYGLRREVIISEDLTELLIDICMDCLPIQVQRYLNEEKNAAGDIQAPYDMEGFELYLSAMVPGIDLSGIERPIEPTEEYIQAIIDCIRKSYELKREMLGPELTQEMMRFIILHAIDNKWRDHLAGIDELREGIHLRSYAQMDPLIEYQREATYMFQDMMADIQRIVFEHFFRMNIATEKQETANVDYGRGPEAPGPGQGGDATEAGQRARKPIKVATYRREEPKVGRNDPCPCGSGKKYKKCCGK